MASVKQPRKGRGQPQSLYLWRKHGIHEKTVVNDSLKAYGTEDDVTHTAVVNKRLSKLHPTHVRPITRGAKAYPEVLDSEVHELTHASHPGETERGVYGGMKKKLTSMSKKAKAKVYSMFRGR